MQIAAEPSVFTIGHSTHPIGAFLGLLAMHGVTALADVRSVPQSRYNPQFSRDSLEAALRGARIAYVFLGRELGARPDDPDCYVAGRVSFERLAATALFQSGLQRVAKGAQSHRIALMCAEKEPLDCHRTLLVSRALVERGVNVTHIHADGALESYRDAMKRLVGRVGLPETDLFRDEQELIHAAAAAQEARIAYAPGLRASAAPTLRD